jgi:hypothetical protein
VRSEKPNSESAVARIALALAPTRPSSVSTELRKA